MSGILEGAAAAAAIGAALAGGAYAAAVLDGAIGGAVAGEGFRWRRALVLPAARTATLLLERRAMTERPDALTWALAPALLGGFAAAGLAAVPLAPAVAVADVPDGIVLFGAAMALVMVAVFLHGWSANSPLALVGGFRFIAQALSYEMPLALVLIAAALPAESLSVGEIVESQSGLWNVVRQPLGLPLFLIAGLGLAFWGPLALPDGTDLAGGTAAETSGVQLLLWRLAQHAVLAAVAAMAAACFLGGWLGPALPGPLWMGSALWMGLKTLALLAVLVAAGHLVSRARIERFVVVAWVILIPLALLDVFVSGALALAGK
ncbi:MAG: NADH-quinone oxidoreductase subunit H [Gemmatimonadota bacterium]